MEETTLTAAQVAELLKIHKCEIYSLVRRGLLPAFRINRRVRFDRELLRRWMLNGGTKGISPQPPTAD